MAPVFTEAWTNGIEPLIAETLPLDEAIDAGADAGFAASVAARVDDGTFASIGRDCAPDAAENPSPAPDAPLLGAGAELRCYRRSRGPFRSGS